MALGSKAVLPLDWNVLAFHAFPDIVRLGQGASAQRQALATPLPFLGSALLVRLEGPPTSIRTRWFFPRARGSRSGTEGLARCSTKRSTRSDPTPNGVCCCQVCHHAREGGRGHRPDAENPFAPWSSVGVGNFSWHHVGASVAFWMECGDLGGLSQHLDQGSRGLGGIGCVPSNRLSSGSI